MAAWPANAITVTTEDKRSAIAKPSSADTAEAYSSAELVTMLLTEALSKGSDES